MWTFSWKFLLTNVKVCIRTCPSFVISLSFFYKFIWFIIRLLAMILLGLLIILLTSCTGCLTVLLLWISPVSLLCRYATLSELWKTVNISLLHSRLLLDVRSVVVLLDRYIYVFSVIAIAFVLRSAAVGIIIFPQFVLCEENLPFVSCCVQSSQVDL